MKNTWANYSVESKKHCKSRNILKWISWIICNALNALLQFEFNLLQNAQKFTTETRANKLPKFPCKNVSISLLLHHGTSMSAFNAIVFDSTTHTLSLENWVLRLKCDLFFEIIDTLKIVFFFPKHFLYLNYGENTWNSKVTADARNSLGIVVDFSIYFNQAD